MATKTVKTLKPPKADVKKTKKIRKPKKITSRQQAQKKKKIPTIKSDKMALRRITKYRKNVEAGKERKSSYMEKMIPQIEAYYEGGDINNRLRFLTKKGTVRKRGIDRNDVIKYNKLIREFNKSPYSKESQRRAIRKKIKESTMSGGLYTAEETEHIINNFADASISTLLDLGGLTSSQMRDISADFLEFDTNTGIIKKIAEELNKRLIRDTPNELKSDAEKNGSKIIELLNLLQSPDDLQDLFYDIVVDELKKDSINRNLSDEELIEKYKDYIDEEAAFRADNYMDNISDIIDEVFFGN